MQTKYYVPEEMKKLNHWILWKLETDEKGKQTKVPYSALYQGKASTTNPEAWTSYENAMKKFDKNIYSGLGFVFTKDAGITFIDLDHCIEKEIVNDYASNITSAFHDTYMELSQSGTGIHIFAKGNIPKAIKKQQIELYDDTRYVAFTGNSINSSEIVSKQAEIDVLYKKYADKEVERVATRTEPLYLNESEIIDKIMNSKQASSFYYYFNGGAEANSENTLALASILAFWCANDSSMIKSIMYKSALVRKKFDRRTSGATWLDLVIEKAIKSTTEVYSPTVRNEYIERKFEEKEILDIKLAESGNKLYYSFDDFDYVTKSKDRILTGYKQLDYLIKGFELGCVSLVTSATNGGKTTFVTGITREAISQGEKVMFYNGEQTPQDFKNNLYKQSVSSEKIYSTRYKDTNIYDYYVADEELGKLKSLYGKNLFVYNNENKKDIDTLLYAMNEVYELYGARMFILDNLMQVEMKERNIFQEQSEVMEKIRAFAVEKNVHCVVVAHPKKHEDNSIRSNIFSVSGSQNLVNKSFNVISLIRKDHLDKEGREYKTLKKYLLANRYDINECDQIVEVLKTKGESCGVVGLKYEPQRKAYTEVKRLTEVEVVEIKKEDKDSKQWTPFD